MPTTISAVETAPGAKARLVESAIALFSEKGYSATTIREIIEDASVTRPVLYYYFKNKEDLFCHLVESQFETVCRDLDTILRSERPWRSRLEASVRGAFARAQASPAMVRLMLHFFFSPPIAGIHLDKEKLGMERFTRIVELMRQGIEGGHLRDTDAEELAMAWAGLVDMHVMAGIDKPEAVWTDDYAGVLVDQFLYGAARR